MLSKVAGGIIANTSNFVKYTITSYLVETATVRDSYPLDNSTVIAPLVAFEYSAYREKPIELGLKVVRANVYYFIDIVGRTNAEKDALTAKVSDAFEKGQNVISGYGNIESDKFSIINYTEYKRNSANFYGNSVMLSVVIDDAI